MLKKIILGTLLLGLTGALVIGAVNRTQSKSTTEAAGGSRQVQAATAGAHEDAAAGQATGWRANGTNGHGGANGEAASSIAETVAKDWITAQGVVTGADGDTLTVKLSDGTTVEVADRGWQYAQEQGFAVKTGDAVTLAGFWEGESFEASAISDLASGLSVTLRDESGRPLWAGAGRGRGG